MKALEKDRNRRYETANGFAMDIQRYLADEPVLACPPSAWYRFRKFARRKKAALAVAACVFLALAGIAGSIGWAVRDKGAREELIAREQQAREKALDQAVDTTLDETRPLMEQEKWFEALAVVERADKLLAAAGRADRPPRLLELRRDLSVAQRLEDIHHGTESVSTPEPALLGKGGSDGGLKLSRPPAPEAFFWGREQDPRFAKEFRDFGIDVDALEPAAAAARVVRTSIRRALVQALDNWAVARRRSKGDTDPIWKKLVEIARQADPDDWRNRCRDALLRRDRQALERLADTVSIPDLPPATLWVFGNVLMELGARDKAVAFLRQAQHEHPDDMWINNTLGWYCWRAFQPPLYDDALRFYSIHLALQPHHVAVHVTVAQIWLEKEALNEAIAEYRKAIELNPKDAGLHINFGIALQEHGKLDEAVAEHSKAIALNPKDALAHINLGLALHDQGMLDEAINEYRTAIALDPKDPRFHSNLGIALYDQGKLDEAVAEHRKAIDLDPKLAPVHLNLGVALRGQGKLDEAIAEYRKAIELDPKNALAHSNLGGALRDQGELDEAIAEYRKAIELAPKLAAAHTYLGFALKDLGKLDEAIAAFSKAIELEPKNAGGHNGLSWLLATFPDARVRDPKRAVALAKKAVELAPKGGNHWNTLGAAHYRAGNWKDAVAALEKSMELRKGGDSVDWFFLAMARWQLGEKEKAREWYDKAAQWMDKNQPTDEQLRRFRGEAAELLGIKDGKK
jgi:tetratricopeptide (TPR) repeat protein